MIRRTLFAIFLLAAVGTAFAAPQIGDVPRQKARKGQKAKRVYNTEDVARERPASPTGVRLAPFVPSPEAVVEQMLALAKVTADDTVYDLGCGDGRIIIMAARKFGAKSVGVELDPDLYKQTAERIKDLKLEDKVKVIHGDMLEQDISPATVVTLYLLTSANEKLRPILEKQLKPGARVISHDFTVPGWTPASTHPVEDGTGSSHTLYLYRR